MQTTLLRQLTGGQYALQRCVEVVVYVVFPGPKDAHPFQPYRQIVSLSKTLNKSSCFYDRYGA